MWDDENGWEKRWEKKIFEKISSCVQRPCIRDFDAVCLLLSTLMNSIPRICVHFWAQKRIWVFGGWSSIFQSHWYGKYWKLTNVSVTHTVRVDRGRQQQNASIIYSVYILVRWWQRMATLSRFQPSFSDDFQMCPFAI